VAKGNRHREAQALATQAPRPSSRTRGYNARWEKSRLTYLAHHPLCTKCEASGHVTPATVVDHIIPHRGDQALFWDTANWQSLCKDHHDSTKQREERRGYVAGSDAAGRPLDPAHPWNRGAP